MEITFVLSAAIIKKVVKCSLLVTPKQTIFKNLNVVNYYLKPPCRPVGTNKNENYGCIQSICSLIM